MSESMVERVARALYDAHPFSGPAYDSDRESYKETFRIQARAAIEAMQTPTRRMLDAGPGEPYMDEEVWAKMIDRALNEQVSG